MGIGRGTGWQVEGTTAAEPVDTTAGMMEGTNQEDCTSRMRTCYMRAVHDATAAR